MNTIFQTESYSTTISVSTEPVSTLQGCYQPFLAENIKNESDFYDNFDQEVENELDEDELQQQDIDLCDPICSSISLDIKQVRYYINELENMKKNSIIIPIIENAYKQVDFAERIINGDITCEESAKYPVDIIDYINWKHVDALEKFEEDFNQYTNDLVEIVMKLRD